MSAINVIIATPDADGAASAAIAARACEGVKEVMFFESQLLADFFRSPVQDKLPSVYTLIVCGLQVVYRNWDGELVRPRLVDSLREFVSPVLLFSAQRWHPEDVAVIEDIIGEENLHVSPAAPCTASLVRRHFAPGDTYAEMLERLACGALSEREEAEWGVKLRGVIGSLRGDSAGLREALAPVIEGYPEEVSPQLVEKARSVDDANRQFAASAAEASLQMGDQTLVPVTIPQDRHAFWREISEYARAQSGADFCLCHLAGRSVLILTRNKDLRVDLRVWVRYLTDMMPAAQTVGDQPEAVTIFIRGLADDPGLKQEALRLLAEGAHLLAR